MAIITTSGFPSDQLGNSGDYAIDPVAHFIYGPKTSTWGGTASSLQGPSGPGMVYGNGAPTTNQGAIGQGYLDLSTGNFYGPKNSQGAWGNAVYKLQGAAGVSVLSGAGSPTTNNVAGINGQTYIDTAMYILYVYNNGAWSSGVSMIGPAGATLLTGTGAGIGPYGVLPSQTISATPTPIYLPGTTIPASFTPIGPSALLGVYAYASATATISFVNVTTGTTVWSAATPSGGGNIVTSYFSATQYPLTAGNTYQFQITGSGTAAAQVEPFYLMPANNPGLAVQICQTAGFATSTTFSSTAQNLSVLGTSTLFVHVPVRTGGVYSAVATYTPTGSTTSSSSVQLSLKYGPATSAQTASGTVGFNFKAVTATGTPQTFLVPQLSDLTSLTTGFYFYWSVTGSGTGTLTVNLYTLV